MIFSRINLRKALVKERDLLNVTNELLKIAVKKDSEVISRLKSSSSDNTFTNTDITESENIFSIKEIRTICIRYRLRFLDTAYFKSEYPYDAVAEINAFEKKYGIKIQSFHIIAPAKAFDLENINKDPLLFARLNDNSFFLLHQWGHDLAWYRKIIAWPLQSFKTLMITLAIMCFIFAFILPGSVMNVFDTENQIYLRLWLTIHTFIGLLGLTLWAGLSFDKTFSGLNWDSKYYNY